MIKIFFDIGYPLVVHLLPGGSVPYQYYSMSASPLSVADFVDAQPGVQAFSILLPYLYDARETLFC